jgi:hypothetical protein
MTTELSPPAPAVEVPPPASIAGAPRVSVLKRVNVVRDILPLAALLALIVYFSVRAEAFLSAANLTLMGRRGFCFSPHWVRPSSSSRAASICRSGRSHY